MEVHFTKYDWAVTSPIIFDKMHFLLISEKELFHEIKCNEMTSFMEFKWLALAIVAVSINRATFKYTQNEYTWVPSTLIILSL